MFERMLLGCLLVVGCVLVSTGNSWAGHSSDCGGGVGCSWEGSRGGDTSDKQDRGESAYAKKIYRFNDLVDQADAAVKARDWAEAIRLARTALSVMDDSELRRLIPKWESQSLVDQANRATNLGDQIDLVRRALVLYEDPEVRAWLNHAQISLDAKNLNDQGLSAYRAGNYEQAERLFAQAQQKDPDPAYAKNVRLASAKIQMQSDQSRVKQGLSQLTDTINRTQAASTATTSGLDFMPVGGAAQSGAGSGTHTFGTTSNPPNPDLGYAAPAPPVMVHSTLEQLSSAAKSGQDAKKAGKIEEAKDVAGCGFDGAPCRAPDPIDFPKSTGQMPGTMELASHIPDDTKAKDDPAIQNSLAWFDKLEKRKAETQMKIVDIQKQIDSGAGDPAVLKAKKSTLDNELNQDTASQVKAKDQIKRRLADLSLQWNESPSPTVRAPTDVPPSNASH